MRALITGITGFVGAHLTGHLRAAGDDVLGTSRRAQAHGRPTISFPAPIVAWDVGDQPDATVRRAVAEFAPDVVYHLAALSVPRDCGDDEPTLAAVRTNVDGVRHVLELAASLPRRPRVVFTSSGRVYAPVDPAAPIVAESYPLAPRTAYGKTKLAGEQLCREAAEHGGLDVVVVRPFSQSGPGMDERLMLAEWAVQFIRGGAGPIEVASLDVTVEFLDVRDGVRALRLLAERGVGGETYNVGSAVPHTTREIYELLRRRFLPARDVREFRPGYRSDPIADVAKLQSTTGWAPHIPAEQTVADVVADLQWRLRP